MKRIVLAVLLVALSACSAIGAPSTGKVTFGSSFDESTLTLNNEHSSFQPSDDMSFRVELPQAVGATSVDVVVLRQKGAGEETVLQQSMPLGNPEWTVFGTTLNLPAVTEQETGTYVLRIYRDTTKLAEGTFTVV